MFCLLGKGHPINSYPVLMLCNLDVELSILVVSKLRSLLSASYGYLEHVGVQVLHPA
jgi:hypothetical protein